MKVVKSESQFVSVEEDAYMLKCVSYEAVPEEKSKFGSYINWYFEIVQEPELEGGKLSGRTPDFLSPDSKLDKWLKGFGVSTEAVGIGEEIDLDQCLGVIVKGVVENKANPKDATKPYSNVVKLLQKRTKPRTAAVQPAAEEKVKEVVEKPVEKPTETPAEKTTVVNDEWEDFEDD